MSRQSHPIIGVLMGGCSSEREVSLRSGAAVADALRAAGHKVVPIDLQWEDGRELDGVHLDVAFIALHGRYGEDGTVQGALEVLKIPYTGSGVMASALSMDKWRTKLVWDASGVPTPRFAMVKATTAWDRLIEMLGMPVIMKPAREGSTIGLTKVSSPNDFNAAYALAARYDNLVIAEEFIAGEELTASILGETALPLVRIEAPQGNYDYHNKYFSDDTKYFCPSGISQAKEQEIRAQSLAAFEVVGCSGWGRLDLILRDDGTYSFLEVNTSPGMTGHSLVPMAARQAGTSFADLCVEILEGAHVG